MRDADNNSQLTRLSYLDELFLLTLGHRLQWIVLVVKVVSEGQVSRSLLCTYSDQLRLFFLGHALQWIVLSSKVTSESGQRLHYDLFHLSSFSA